MSKLGDKHWTREQVEYLALFFPVTEAHCIAPILGKTQDAVRTKVARLGITRQLEILPSGQRRCPHCHIIKPLLTGFYEGQSWCRDCHGAIRTVWGKKNLAYLREYNKERYAKDPEKQAEREATACRGSHKSRAIIKSGHDLTRQQWEQILVTQNNICPVCGMDFSSENPPKRDCIIPVLKGGLLTMGNIQAVHNWCNIYRATRSEQGGKFHLTASRKQEIRMMFQDSKVSQRQFAKKIGMSREVIRKIIACHAGEETSG